MSDEDSKDELGSVLGVLLRPPLPRLLDRLLRRLLLLDRLRRPLRDDFDEGEDRPLRELLLPPSLPPDPTERSLRAWLLLMDAGDLGGRRDGARGGGGNSGYAAVDFFLVGLILAPPPVPEFVVWMGGFISGRCCCCCCNSCCGKLEKQLLGPVVVAVFWISIVRLGPSKAPAKSPPAGISFITRIGFEIELSSCTGGGPVLLAFYKRYKQTQPSNNNI